MKALQMKNPPHPGKLIEDDLKELGLSVAQAAKGIGVTRQQLYRVISGDCGITPEMAIRLEKAFGGTADFWLRLQSAYDLAQARKTLGKIKVSRLAEVHTVPVWQVAEKLDMYASTSSARTENLSRPLA
ncbi:MAG: Antitoxin HigA [Nitrospira sp.]|jgi:addiction module HigA family antidote|nr:Antitoxin HigA [Nitrospira sp.]